MLCGLYGDHYCGREEDDLVRRVLLEQQSGGRSLGLTVRGGQELGTGLYVCGLDRGGHAQLQGLRVGDRILRVNDVDFRRISHRMATEIIRRTTRMIVCVTSSEAHRMPRILPLEARPIVTTTLTSRPRVPRPPLTRPLLPRVMLRGPITPRPRPAGVRRAETLMYPDVAAARRIRLHADMDGYLGLSLRGGVDRSTPAIVSGLDSASPASRAGLKVGDLILKVNGGTISHLTHGELVRKVTARPHLSLLVRRPSTSSHSNTPTHDPLDQRRIKCRDLPMNLDRVGRENALPIRTSSMPYYKQYRERHIRRNHSTKPSSQSDDTSGWLLKLISQTIRLNLDDNLEKKTCIIDQGSYLSPGLPDGTNVVKNDINAPIDSSSNSDEDNSESHVNSTRHTELCYWNIPPISIV